MADQIAPFPDMVLEPGMSLVFRAVDMSTGTDVAGVPVLEISVYVDPFATDAAAGPPIVIPPFLPYGPNT